jgi:hypothetical protein
MKYDLKTLSIILLVAPIRYVHMIQSGGDPMQFIYPLLIVGASLVLAGVMKVSIFHQLIIAISTILPNLLVSFVMMGGGMSKSVLDLLPVAVQIILQGFTAILILNGLNPFIALIITTSIIPLVAYLKILSENNNTPKYKYNKLK